jgi:hypothetical protein
MGCKSARDEGPVIWIGNADLADYSDVVADFSNAFASDALCRGIRIETHKYPDEPYWFLETYSSAASGAGTHEFADGISWWMLRRNKGEDIARFDGSDESSAKAAHHICFIIKGRGGEVH